jgi:lysophospholipase L1-like esterase
MNKITLTVLVLLFTIVAAKAQDWPNLNKYRDANRKVPPAAAGEKRVVYMGDSITEFWMDKDSAFFVSNSYINRGISGQTTGQMLLRFQQDVVRLKPDVVVILAGINDIAQNNGPEKLEDIFGNIVSMAELAKANHIKVVISSVLPAFALPWRPAIDPVPQVAALNELLKAYADKNKITYLDYFTAMADERKGLPVNFSKDGVHPSLAGYKVMEPLAVKAINTALSKKQ